MAYNYSFSEMQNLQDDAIRRVREMQKQARLTTVKEQTKEPKIDLKEKPETDKKTKPEEATKDRIAPYKKNLPPSLLKNDPESADQALLIALLLLFKKEKADTALILALLYILF